LVLAALDLVLFTCILRVFYKNVWYVRYRIKWNIWHIMKLLKNVINWRKWGCGSLSSRCRSTPVEDRVSRSSRVRAAPTSCRAFLVRTLSHIPNAQSINAQIKSNDNKTILVLLNLSGVYWLGIWMCSRALPRPASTWSPTQPKDEEKEKVWKI